MLNLRDLTEKPNFQTCHMKWESKVPNVNLNGKKLNHIWNCNRQGSADKMGKLHVNIDKNIGNFHLKSTSDAKFTLEIDVRAYLYFLERFKRAHTRKSPRVNVRKLAN